MAFTLIVKGDLHTCVEACEKRGIEISSVATHDKFRECIMTVWSDHATLGKWFGETHTAPFPPGSLTYYGEQMRNETWRDVVPTPEIKGYRQVN